MVERKSLAGLARRLVDGQLAYTLAEMATFSRAAVVVEDRYSNLFKVEHTKPNLREVNPMTARPSPLEPQRFFAQTWQGEGELALRGLLAHLPGARRFSFRSLTTMVSDDFWIVHDETRWEDGRVELRDGLCRRLDETTLRMTYDDMLGGTEVRLRSDGYDLGPYTMLVSAPGTPLRLPVRCTDSCRLEPDGTLVDSIDLSVLGLRVGRQFMRLTARAAR